MGNDDLPPLHQSPMFVDAALVCTGRVPATKDMGLEENGIETFRGFVQAIPTPALESSSLHLRSRVVGVPYTWAREL